MIKVVIIHTGLSVVIMTTGSALTHPSNRKKKIKKVNAENIRVFIRIFTNEVITHININSFDDWTLIWRIHKIMWVKYIKLFP